MVSTATKFDRCLDFDLKNFKSSLKRQEARSKVQTCGKQAKAIEKI